MTIGTKSVLYGAHCWFIHPWFVAIAWWKLYGFPWDPRLWVAFFVHDLGYWGKPNMDGEEGEQHVYWGADLMYGLFGHKWWEMCTYHSRYWAKKINESPSKLCYADKLAFVITPTLLYMFLVSLTGEWREYAAAHAHEVFPNSIAPLTFEQWYYPSRKYVQDWVDMHKDGNHVDTWTKEKPAYGKGA